MARIWRVVGGGDKGGIVVRRGEDVQSELCERLSTGAVVAEVDLQWRMGILGIFVVWIFGIFHGDSLWELMGIDGNWWWFCGFFHGDFMGIDGD